MGTIERLKQIIGWKEKIYSDLLLKDTVNKYEDSKLQALFLRFKFSFQRNVKIIKLINQTFFNYFYVYEKFRNKLKKRRN